MNNARNSEGMCSVRISLSF